MNMLLALLLTLQTGELKYIDPPSKPYAYIEMESRTDCLPCLRWKYTEKKKLEAAGWTVYERTTVGEAPRFRVVVGAKKVVQVGYLTMERLREIVEKGK
jgi:hypothetical protein